MAAWQATHQEPVTMHQRIVLQSRPPLLRPPTSHPLDCLLALFVLRLGLHLDALSDDDLHSNNG